MKVSPQEAALIPNFRLYQTMAAISDVAMTLCGGYSSHNNEAVLALQGQPFIVAPNHRSNSDSFVIGEELYQLGRPVHFMAKNSLWKYPGVRRVLDGCGAFPVVRDGGVGLSQEQNAHIKHIVDENGVLLIYMEGHRYPKDAEAVDEAKVRKGQSYLALLHGLPVLPVGIAGRRRNLSKLPKEMVFGQAINVAKHPDPGSDSFKRDQLELMHETYLEVEKNYQLARIHLAERENRIAKILVELLAR